MLLFTKNSITIYKTIPVTKIWDTNLITQNYHKESTYIMTTTLWAALLLEVNKHIYCKVRRILGRVWRGTVRLFVTYVNEWVSAYWQRDATQRDSRDTTDAWHSSRDRVSRATRHTSHVPSVLWLSLKGFGVRLCISPSIIKFSIDVGRGKADRGGKNTSRAVRHKKSELHES